jgi:hypothetical protein
VRQKFDRARTLLPVLLLSAAPAKKEEPWHLDQKSPITIRSRGRAGTGIKDIWADGIIAANSIDIQNCLTDVSRFPTFMPYLVEARKLDIPPEPDGSYYIYSRLEFPFLIGPRDFVHRVHIDRDARTDLQHVFANHWVTAPDKIPRREGVIRLTTTEGSWLVVPAGPSKSHATYKFSVDPGGNIPAFAANMGNTDGVTKTFKSVEREALRRASERALGASPESNAKKANNDGH